MSQYQVHPARVLHAAGGSERDAWLLLKIIFWSRYAKAVHNGHRWVIRSHDEWSEETGLSKRQVQRSIASLKQKKIIDTERHLFGKDVRCWIRLTNDARVVMGLPKTGKTR